MSIGLILQTDMRGVASLTLNRAEKHNAFDDTMIADLLQVLDKIENDNSIRVLVLRAAGKSFSADADLDWMRRMADYDQKRNLADARKLAQLMYRLDRLKKPVTALVQAAKTKSCAIIAVIHELSGRAQGQGRYKSWQSRIK